MQADPGKGHHDAIDSFQYIFHNSQINTFTRKSSQIEPFVSLASSLIVTDERLEKLNHSFIRHCDERLIIRRGLYCLWYKSEMLNVRCKIVASGSAPPTLRWEKQ